MKIRATHTLRLELPVEVDATHIEGSEPVVTALRIGGIDVWPGLRNDTSEGASQAWEQLRDQLLDWQADNLAESLADARAQA